MISVIIPVYNVENYLDQCITSVLDQSYSDFECILIDDGSEDNSGTICDYWSAQDNRIKVIHQLNGGVSSARNKGINAATGEYIFFVDSDDWIEPDYLCDFIKVQGDDIDLVVSGMICFISDTEIDRLIYDDMTLFVTPEYINDFVNINKEDLLHGPMSKLYRTSIIKNNGIYFDCNFSFGEDLLFNYAYLNYVTKIVSLSSCKYHYRKGNENSLSSKYSSDRFDVNYYQWKVLKDFYLNRKMWNDYSKSYLYNRLWGQVYDGIFAFPLIKNLSRTYISNILSIPEIKDLKEWDKEFDCAVWIKILILRRFTNIFYIYFKIKLLLK